MNTKDIEDLERRISEVVSVKHDELTALLSDLRAIRERHEAAGHTNDPLTTEAIDAVAAKIATCFQQIVESVPPTQLALLQEKIAAALLASKASPEP